jgi:hypothetical protein
MREPWQRRCWLKPNTRAYWFETCAEPERESQSRLMAIWVVPMGRRPARWLK